MENNDDLIEGIEITQHQKVLELDVLPSLSILISVFVNFSNSHGQRRMALRQDGDTSPERRLKRNATHVEVLEAEETGRWF